MSKLTISIETADTVDETQYYCDGAVETKTHAVQHGLETRDPLGMGRNSKTYKTNQTGVVLKIVTLKEDLKTNEICNEIFILRKLNEFKFAEDPHYNLAWMTHTPWFHEAQFYVPIVHCEQPLFRPEGGTNLPAITSAIHLTNALRHLHRKGIAHNDVKPDNVGVYKGTHLLLFDFGRSQFRSFVEEKDGTRAFMSFHEYEDRRIGDVVSAGFVIFLVCMGNVKTQPWRSTDSKFQQREWTSFKDTYDEFFKREAKNIDPPKRLEEMATQVKNMIFRPPFAETCYQNFLTLHERPACTVLKKT